MSETSIGISRHLKAKLIELKEHHRQSYEDIIWDLINGHLKPWKCEKK